MDPSGEKKWGALWRLRFLKWGSFEEREKYIYKINSPIFLHKQYLILTRSVKALRSLKGEKHVDGPSSRFSGDNDFEKHRPWGDKNLQKGGSLGDKNNQKVTFFAEHTCMA